MAGWTEGLKVAKELTSKVNSATNGHLTAGVAGAIAGGVMGGSYEAFSDKRYSSVSDGFLGGAMVGAVGGVGLNYMARGIGSAVGKGVESLKVGKMTKTAQADQIANERMLAAQQRQGFDAETKAIRQRNAERRGELQEVPMSTVPDSLQNLHSALRAMQG